MASPTLKLPIHIPNYVRVYKDGTQTVPSSTNPITGVQSKDFAIDPERGLSARLYIPKIANPNNKKLPLLTCFHGGGFCIETAASPNYHNYINSLAAEAQVVVVSVDYRSAPEHPLPIAYDDSWAAIKWVATQSNRGGGDEVWLNDHADFDRVFFSGDSAGANIAHNMGIRVGLENPDGLNVVGIALVHLYFGWTEPIGGERDKLFQKEIADKLWLFACPTSSGVDDPSFNPAMDPNFSKLGCGKVLVFVGGIYFLKDRGLFYKEELGKSGWGGVVEVMESEGEDHSFHLTKLNSDNAVALIKRLAAFMN